MKLEDVAGYNYVDYKPKKVDQDVMAKADVCSRMKKAIGDELQAIMEYKGLVLHESALLSDEDKKMIIEMANDETDHRAKFEHLKDKYC